MNKEEILNKYIDLIDKGYCSDCNELNCIDNFPHSKIARAIRELQQENEKLKADYGTKVQVERDLLKEENKILKENAENNDKVVDKVNWENMLLKKQLKDKTEDYKRMKDNFDSKVDVLTKIATQQKEFIKYLEDEISKQKNDIFANALTSEDIDLYIMKIKLQELEEILSKYKEIIGDDIE